MLALADSSKWDVVGGDSDASTIVSQLLRIMQIKNYKESGRRIRVVTSPCCTIQSDASGDIVVYCPVLEKDLLATGRIYRQILQPIVREVISRGGLLVHAGLIELDGRGMILAGRSGVGKTTACKRIQPPARCLCDDLIMLVRDSEGRFWAHPMPTWSALAKDPQNCSWDVQHAVPMRGIFFLRQADYDRAEPVCREQALCLLVKASEQGAMNVLGYQYDQEILRADRMRRFESVCAVTRAVPTFILDISLEGPYWQEVSRALGIAEDEAAIEERKP